jgi:hypothetical protein
MTLVEWIDNGSDFGNAAGMDYVPLDVMVAIVTRFGGNVLVGQLPDDIAARQGPPRDRTTPTQPFAAVTISWDGGSVSGLSHDGLTHSRGYTTHDCVDRIAPDTVVFDLRPVPENRIVRLAVHGPMLNPALPPGMISTLGPVPDDLRPVLDAYHLSYIAGAGSIGPS